MSVFRKMHPIQRKRVLDEAKIVYRAALIFISGAFFVCYPETVYTSSFLLLWPFWWLHEQEEDFCKAIVVVVCEISGLLR